jgi:hypothetical protein
MLDGLPERGRFIHDEISEMSEHYFRMSERGTDDGGRKLTPSLER